MITKNPMQLKAYIKKKAAEKHISAQLVMQNYMLERLLERISLSPYVKGKIALIVCGVLVHDGFQRSDHVHIFKLLHGLHLQFFCLFPWRCLFALLLFCGIQLCPDGRLFSAWLCGTSWLLVPFPRP